MSSERDKIRAHPISTSPRSHYSEPNIPTHSDQGDALHHRGSAASGASKGSSRHTLHRRASRPNHLAARANDRQHHHDYDLHAGAEPGVDPRSGRAIAEYSHFRQDCIIDVVDYDCDDITFRRVSNKGLVDMLDADVAGRDGKAQSASRADDAASLPPRMVRWINIGGIDWGVLSALAVRYKLHSLALEDILHERGHNHSKADYYPGHLFIRVLSHSLELEEAEQHLHENSGSDQLQQQEDPLLTDSNGPLTTTLDLESGEYVVLYPGHDKEVESSSKFIPESAENSLPTSSKRAKLHQLYSPITKRFSGLSGFGGEARERKNKEIQALKKGDRVCVKQEAIFIFLMPNGTVISLHPAPDLDFTFPIAERLHRPDSILRVSEDASILVESLLDLVVDRVLEVIDEYQVKINQLEHEVLLHPVMRSVRSLHILSGDMIMHKRTLDPIKTMLYGLRYYDTQRAQAIAANVARERRVMEADGELTADEDSSTSVKDKQKAQTPSKTKNQRRRERKRALLKAERSHNFSEPVKARMRSESSLGHPGNAIGSEETPQQGEVHGYFSFQAKVYLADVSDHMDFAITSLEMFAGISENLLNYAFNIASYDMNVIMNRLTVTTIIFLPLTLLTGYFGMNFTPFWSVDHNSDFFFWKIALPAMGVLIPILMYRDIKELLVYNKRRADTQRVASYFSVSRVDCARGCWLICDLAQEGLRCHRGESVGLRRPESLCDTPVIESK